MFDPYNCDVIELWKDPKHELTWGRQFSSENDRNLIVTCKSFSYKSY